MFKCQPDGGAWGKVRGLPKSIRFILCVDCFCQRVKGSSKLSSFILSTSQYVHNWQVDREADYQRVNPPMASLTGALSSRRPHERVWLLESWSEDAIILIAPCLSVRAYVALIWCLWFSKGNTKAKSLKGGWFGIWLRGRVRQIKQ